MARLLVVSRNAALAIGLTLADHDVVDLRPDRLAGHDLENTPVDAVIIDIDDPPSALGTLEQLHSVAAPTATLIVSSTKPGWANIADSAPGNVVVLPSPVSRQNLLIALDGLLAQSSPAPDVAPAPPPPPPVAAAPPPPPAAPPVEPTPPPVPTASPVTEVLPSPAQERRERRFGRKRAAAATAAETAVDAPVEPAAEAAAKLEPVPAHIPEPEPIVPEPDPEPVAVEPEPEPEPEPVAVEPEPEPQPAPPAPQPVTVAAASAASPLAAPPREARPSRVRLSRKSRTAAAAAAAATGAVAASQAPTDTKPRRRDDPVVVPPPAPAPVAAPAPASALDLVRALVINVDDLTGVPETADIVVDEAVNRTRSEAGALLVPDGLIWRVAAGVGLRPLEHRLQLAPEHWLVVEAVDGGHSMIIADSDVARHNLFGAPLSSWEHLVIAPIPSTGSVMVVARHTEQYDELELAQLETLAEEAAQHIRAALDARQLARAMEELRDPSD